MVNCVPVLHTSENLIQKNMGCSRFAHLWNIFFYWRDLKVIGSKSVGLLRYQTPL